MNLTNMQLFQGLKVGGMIIRRLILSIEPEYHASKICVCNLGEDISVIE